MVAPEVWIEGDRQKAALASGGHSAPDVEERLGLHVAVIEDLDGPSLLDHVEESGLSWRVRHVGRGREVPDLALGDPAAPVAGPRVALGGGRPVPAASSMSASIAIAPSATRAPVFAARLARAQA